jgi:hypothetical protein
MPTRENFPKWDSELLKNPVNLLDWANEYASATISWYQKRSRKWKNWSKSLTFSIIVFIALGTIAPILEALQEGGPRFLSKISEALGDVSFIELGYFSFALAGIIYLGDKTFGVSKGWVRSTLTMIKLENLHSEFLIQYPRDKQAESNVDPSLPMILEFVRNVNSVRMDETTVWSKEFSRALDELYKEIDKTSKGKTS